MLPNTLRYTVLGMAHTARKLMEQAAAQGGDLGTVTRGVPERDVQQEILDLMRQCAMLIGRRLPGAVR